MDNPRRTGTPCCACDRTQAAPEPCCGPRATEPAPRANARWIEGSVATSIGEVPRVATTLSFADTLGTWKARWGIGRMRYRVPPGLYAVGAPTPESPVLLSANYKMSFDRLRSQLGGRHAWILVLDTDGINVWCAAGGGAFGTDEIGRRTEAVRLAERVSHRTLVVPQLAATGVSAHEVRQRSGWRVVYGPVRAEDLPAFLDAGMKATAEMRRVRFPLRDRLAVVPIELVQGAKHLAVAAAGFLLLGGLGPDGYSLARAMAAGWRSVALLAGAYLAGAALTPMLLPWLPGRAFAVKGAWAGLALGAAACAGAYPWLFEGRLGAAAWLAIIPTAASFLALNFTGASTYTSLSGVRLEVRVAVPIQAACAAAGVGLWIAARFV